ncbi:MAG TPA: hydroxyisourate hydrolase [Nannocystaceae bacterium]|nr:hydroxyisourate hydrolase [Nannocystaceae bacterium]
MSNPAGPLTTHVLDTTLGKPARGIEVRLELREGDAFRELARGTTDDDGRVKGLLAAGALRIATYRLRFAVADYFAADGRACFYPEVAIEFAITRPDEHHHVPLLLSPFGYSTYRGS